MSDDHGSVIHYEAGQHVARITLNRPGKLNALNSALVDGLQAALSRAAADDLVKVVVLKGAGRAFSAGYDLSEEAEDQTWNANSWHRALSKDVEMTLGLLRLPKPTITAVHGWCLAGACDLAMACDMIIATDDA